MANFTINWNGIRPLDGSQATGFEELCAQLARTEKPTGARFERKGTPDAGVECYAVLIDGTEWAWQAKYFDALGDSQWSQLDESVKTAIEKHPRLVQYFVCVPLDRPDARMSGRKSAKERWDEHVTKWAGWASAKAMAVTFIYWGSHELLERLALPQHIGRVRFWFGGRGFDREWLTARLDEALRTAGPRYSPEIHVDLPIALKFEAFGRTERFFDRLKGHAREIREKLRSSHYSKTPTEPLLEASAAAVSSKVETVLIQLGALKPRPVGPLSFVSIADQIQIAATAVDELVGLLTDREQEQEKTRIAAALPPVRDNPFRDRQFRLYSLSSELESAREALAEAEKIAGSSLMLMRGAAGTGKTHLLCDLARQRVNSGRPTVLLMGQQFVSNDAPWSQALQHLDMASLSAEEFVGALEAAAQAAGSRALLLIDAINEGAGRTIWPNHLASFLLHLERSAWIGVVLSVRSSYEEIIIPVDVRSRAATVTHQGFTEHEYDAAKTFFVHYDLELPSTPLLAPEFRNPLFLKTLCRGLNAKGERRLPRGFHGVTAVFDLYLDAINERLSATVGFDPRRPFVRHALEAISKELLNGNEQLLPLTQAQETVNALLPGREFERSLYRGLVVEGVLVEEVVRGTSGHPEDVVFIGYERFADHVAAKTLLDRHLDPNGSDAAFAPGGPLAFICDDKSYVSPGLLEALCIQVPERTGRELISLAPNCVNRWGLGDAFRQSIIWRANDAFTISTNEALDKFCGNEHGLHDTLDVLLTVATLPGHPLNALFLDRRLRKDAMPERDSWWSIYLHRAWGAHGAVDRLVDWASSITSDTLLDDEIVDLCAISLSWMFTTSNRFLRDRATKALVSLLTGRLPSVVRLIDKFADVDDPYVMERIYAAAYGTAMRCHDPVTVGALAVCVYNCVFATGSPPPHILLRDYARGVIERALHLGSAVDIVVDHIRPPYKSEWPTIPTEEEIKPFLPNWSRGSHDSGEPEWARNRIANSVMSDDFARYVIGTNFSSGSSHWLSLRLDEPPWTPPPRAEDLINALMAELSDEERIKWDELDSLTAAIAKATQPFIDNWFSNRERDGTVGDRADSASDDIANEMEKSCPPEMAALEGRKVEALTALEAVLTTEHAERRAKILASKEHEFSARQPPRFDLGQIQRYVLKRVFDLGWTTERFGNFDRFSIGYHGRQASKAERMGKKYQWIAYHEIMALVADHFQYREPFNHEEDDQAYEGPWQDHLRDLDPSCTIRRARGGTSWSGHIPAWWGPARYDSWGNPTEPREWALNSADLPKMRELLTVTNPANGSKWISGHGYLNWRQQAPADREATDVERRELWYMYFGYLIPSEDAQSFMQWAEGVDFWGRWMPEAAVVYQAFLGEHAWAPASHFFKKQYYGDGGWTRPDHGCPTKLRTVAFDYLREAGCFDCSVDESYTLHLPVSELVTALGVRWSGTGADFVDSSDRLAAQDPTAHADGPSVLLLRQDLVRDFLTREQLTLCWAVLGEKRAISPGIGSDTLHVALQISGAYILGPNGVNGFLKCTPDHATAGGENGQASTVLRE